MPERTFSSPEYRYGFNGKEKDESGEWGSATYIDPDTGEEKMNSLTHYDYGFRIYNPGIAKFLSVDPLTRTYPMLTPYQFASNTPIQAIDLDGLEAYFVHGTGANAEAWDSDPELKFAIADKMDNTTVYDEFIWNGNNNSTDREIGADELVDLILSSREEGQPITIVGHSHGGNLGIVAVNKLREMSELDGVEINLVTLNTIHRDDYELNATAFLNGVTNHYNLFVFDDVVAQNHAGYDLTGKINETGVGKTHGDPGTPPKGTIKRTIISLLKGKKFFKTERGRKMGGEAGRDAGHGTDQVGQHPNAQNIGLTGVKNFMSKLGGFGKFINQRKNHRLWQKKYGQSEKAKEAIDSIKRD